MYINADQPLRELLVKNEAWRKGVWLLVLMYSKNPLYIELFEREWDISYAKWSYFTYVTFESNLPYTVNTAKFYCLDLSVPPCKSPQILISNQFTFGNLSQQSKMHFILKAVAFTFAIYLMAIGTDNCLACPFHGNFNCSGSN